MNIFASAFRLVPLLFAVLKWLV